MEFLLWKIIQIWANMWPLTRGLIAPFALGGMFTFAYGLSGWSWWYLIFPPAFVAGYILLVTLMGLLAILCLPKDDNT